MNLNFGGLRKMHVISDESKPGQPTYTNIMKYTLCRHLNYHNYRLFIWFLQKLISRILKYTWIHANCWSFFETFYTRKGRFHIMDNAIIIFSLQRLSQSGWENIALIASTSTNETTKTYEKSICGDSHIMYFIVTQTFSTKHRRRTFNVE